MSTGIYKMCYDKVLHFYEFHKDFKKRHDFPSPHSQQEVEQSLAYSQVTKLIKINYNMDSFT